LELQAQLDDTARDLQQQRREAEAASQEASGALQRAAAASQEASRQRARVAEVEGEMRELLAAVEAQKATNAAKMRQLATLLHDM
jgi:leucine-rich repeat/coiled-coil domain-containing protein 1